MEEKAKLCPKCRKEVSDLATKCPFCQSTIRPKNDGRNLVLTALGVIFGLFILAASLGGSGSTSTSSTSASNSDLSATVEKGASGVYITNNEGAEWTGCMVGVNGGDGWGFDNPPYQTPATLSFMPDKKTLVRYDSMTTKDGTFFDISTHQANSVVVVCSKGTPQARYWSGS